MALLSYALLLALPATEGPGGPVIHHDAVDCMVAHVFQLRQFVPQVVTATGLTSTGACQPPFTVSLARAVLQDTSGGEKFRTGQDVPDIPITLHFVP